MIFIDSETYSEVKLTSEGLDNYAQNCEVILLTYAIGDGPAKVWEPQTEAAPEDLIEALKDETRMLVAANSQFDRTVFQATKLFGDVYLEPDRWIDTMIQATMHGLPAALGVQSEVFGLGEEGKKDGRKLLLLFTRPRRGGRATKKTHPEQWFDFREYARMDTVSMRVLFKKMPKWNYPGIHYESGIFSPDYYLWVLDQKINKRGFQVDVELAEAAVAAEAAEKKALEEATQELTDGALRSTNQRDALLKYVLEEYGVTLPNTQAATIQRRAQDERLPVELRELLSLRIQTSRNAAAKYKAVLNSVSPDNRLRNTLQFAGAQTGRWTGRVFQPQNLMRPTMEQEAVAKAVEDIKSGMATFFYDDLSEVLGNCVRGVVVAPPKRKLIVVDLSAIEGVLLAYLANDTRIVDFYRQVQAGEVDYDSYMLAYSMVFGGPPSEATGDKRQIGKPIELAHGYGGGVAAFGTFASTYNLNLPELAEKVWAHGDPAQMSACLDRFEWAAEQGFHGGFNERLFAAFEYVKQRWRAARQPTEGWWQELAQGFAHAANHPNETFRAGNHIAFRMTGSFLRMRLPTGRVICMPHARASKGELTFMGMDPYSKQWSRQMTHGGKLSGICTQATAREILAAALPKLEAAGYQVVLTVHDEVIVEAPDTADYSVEEVASIMTQQPKWGKDLPLAADGFETYRYRKD